VLIEDHGPAATIARLEGTLDLCFHALSEGISVAGALHAEKRWDPRADPHMFTHAARREALEVIKAQNPEARAEDNLGASMSGLHIEVGGTDVLRVWHGYNGQVRVPDSEAGRDFLRQVSSSAAFLPGFELPEVPRVCRTILLWEHRGGELSRFTLLRPLGAEEGTVLVDWQESLLERFAQRVDDVVYRRRETAGGREPQTS